MKIGPRPHVIALAAGLLTCASLGARAEATADSAPPEMAMHEHHHVDPKLTVSTVQYTVPDVTLVRADGKTVSLADEINDGRPVLLNFIFTTCGSVCPLMSAMFSQFQTKLGADAGTVHLMSISIDPEQDTPARLIEYAKQYGAGPEWQHYTGTLQASLAAQRAFDVYRGDKMSHAPVTLMRIAPGRPWLRINGFMTPDALMGEYRKLLASASLASQ